MWVCPQCHLVFRNQRLGICPVHGKKLVEQDFDPLVGRTVDRYQILERLGGGAMGSVYRAKHAVLDRPSAVKVLYGEFAHDENLRKRFEREAKAVSRMRHPNVVEVSDFGSTADGVTFLVMDYIDGRPLDQIIAEEAPISPGRTVRIARQIAAGLYEAHRQGFVHRDMKPPNVLITGPVEQEMVRILDFGLVSLLYKKMDAERLTIEGQLVGTPMYMSPEQTLDSAVGPRSDLYSLGVIMFEMLTGRPPFMHEGRIALMFAHVHQPAPPLPSSGGLEGVVRRLLAKKPEQRYPDARALIDALDRLDLPDDTSPHRPLVFSDRTENMAAPDMSTATPVPLAVGEEFIEETEVSEISQELRVPAERILSPFARLSVMTIEASTGESSGSIARIEDEFRVRHVTNLKEAVRALSHEQLDAIVVDLGLPDFEFVSALGQLRDAAPRTPLIVLSPRAPESLALEAAEHGAAEFLVKSDTTPVGLARAVRFAVARSRATQTGDTDAPKPTMELAPSMLASMGSGLPLLPPPSPPQQQGRSTPLLIALALGLFGLGAVAGTLATVVSKTGGGRTSPAVAQASTWEIDSTPDDATVIVEGVLVGKTPLLLTRPLPPDPVEVTLRKNGYVTWSRRVVPEGDRLVVNAELERSEP